MHSSLRWARPLDGQGRVTWLVATSARRGTWVMAGRQVPSDGQEILSYYERIDEANRLARGGGQLELARMQELIRRFLPAPPGMVLDVGGGAPAGIRAGWLSRAMTSTSSTL